MTERADGGGHELVAATLAKLAAAGVSADGDPFEVFERLWLACGRRCTGLDLYALVARSRDRTPLELPRQERRALAEHAASVMFVGFESIGTTGNRPVEPVEVVPYDQGWPLRFERWRRLVVDALGSTALRVEHVGSTAVPGLPAKPVVDLQVSVADLSDEDAYVTRLEPLGVRLYSRDHDHRFFRPEAGHRREVHLHVTKAGSSWEREHLLFRDYLRTDARARVEYRTAKRQAAVVWRDDRFAYTEAKTDVVLDILDRAERWATTTGWQLP